MEVFLLKGKGGSGDRGDRGTYGHQNFRRGPGQGAQVFNPRTLEANPNTWEVEAGESL